MLFSINLNKVWGMDLITPRNGLLFKLFPIGLGD